MWRPAVSIGRAAPAAWAGRVGGKRELVGAYTHPGANGSGDILVSVRIYLFTDQNTAIQVHQNLRVFCSDGVAWNYRFYSPLSNPGWFVCAAD
jgi:hypothetical protein